MADGVYQIDMNQVVMTADGITVDEFEDEAASFEWLGEEVELKQGSHGSVMFIFKPANAGKVTVTLLKGSPGNKVFSDIWRRRRTGGSPFFAFRFKDLLGGELIEADVAAVAKGPQPKYASGGDGYQWEILLAKPKVDLGSAAVTVP